MPVQRLSKGFKDLSASFQTSPLSNDLIALKNESAIARSVRNLVLTIQGERPFQPEKGSRLRQMLFENFDIFMLEELKEEIVNTLGRLEPRITVSQVNVDIDDDNNLEVEVEYVIIGERITQTVDFLLERT